MIPLIIFAVVFGGVIFIALGLVCIPPIQRELVYLHHANWPFGSLAIPERFGLAPSKTRNFYLDTPDGERLGVWHILPRSTYQSATTDFPPHEPLSTDRFEQALTERPTILFFHGNAANRAVPYRIRIYTALSQQLDCNVLVTDYRGFGDSTGTPTPAGLVMDARTVFDYVTSTTDRLRGPSAEAHSSPEADIILMGHSLGTGVITQLAAQLSDEGLADRLRAVILVSPFTSITDVMLDYTTLAFLPPMARMGRIPGLTSVLNYILKHKYESIHAISHIASHIPILLMHARNDWTIPITHSRRLFEKLKDREATDGNSLEVEQVEVPHWGIVRSFTGKGGGSVRFWEGELGGHNDLGWTEGGLDLVKQSARL